MPTSPHAAYREPGCLAQGCRSHQAAGNRWVWCCNAERPFEDLGPVLIKPLPSPGYSNSPSSSSQPSTCLAPTTELCDQFLQCGTPGLSSALHDHRQIPTGFYGKPCFKDVSSLQESNQSIWGLARASLLGLLMKHWGKADWGASACFRRGAAHL